MLQALVKVLDDVSDEEIKSLEVPTGVPLIYELNDDLKPVRHYFVGYALARQLSSDPTCCCLDVTCVRQHAGQRQILLSGICEYVHCVRHILRTNHERASNHVR